MACIDYHTGATNFPFKSAGWFFLGIPFIGITAVAYSLIFCLLRRLTTKRIGWMLLVASSVALITLSIINNLPRTRVEQILNTGVPTDIELISLITRDSFNGGMTYKGKLSGSDREMANLIKTLPLKPKNDISPHNLQETFPDAELSEHGKIYGFDEKSSVVYVNQSGKSLYFSIRNR